MTIKLSTEELTINGIEHYQFALTGNTYEAKEIIKAHGMKFSDWNGKAWRTPAIEKSAFVPGNAGFTTIQNIIRETLSALKDAGYTVIR